MVGIIMFSKSGLFPRREVTGSMTTELHAAELVTELSSAFPTEAFRRVVMKRGLRVSQRQMLQHTLFSVEVCVCVGPVCVYVALYANVRPVRGIQETPLPLSRFITQLFAVPGLIA